MFDRHDSPVVTGPDALVEHAKDMGSVLAGVDPDALGDDELMETALVLESLRRRLDATSARVVGRLDATGATEVAVGLKTKRWKANRTHAADSTVARELRVASALARFGLFAEALADGSLSVDHVLAVSNAGNPRVVDALVTLEPSLVDFARKHRFGVFVRHLRHLVALLDQDGAEPDCGDRDQAHMGIDSQNNLHLSVELTGHNATVAAHIIDTETDRQYRQASREHDATGAEIPATPVLRARAIAELLRRGIDSRPDSPKPAVEAMLPVTVDSNGHPTGVHSTTGNELDPVTAAVLLCDAHLHPVVVDSTGTPIDVGRTERFFSPSQRRALVLRDGGCVFPGCDQPPARCDAHHELPWEDGGKTDLHNGALLCRRHHGLLHGHNPWMLESLDVDELPADLAAQHRQRAADARLDPTTRVRVWTTPTAGLVLAQTSTDHRGPAPPTRTPAA